MDVIKKKKPIVNIRHIKSKKRKTINTLDTKSPHRTFVGYYLKLTIIN